MGYNFCVEYYSYPRLDGTFFNQKKIAIELFYKPFGLIVSIKKNGMGKTYSIQKEVGDEFAIE